MEKSFESSLKELEGIIRKLEDGYLPLEESLRLFEQGVKLSRECRERLSSAERRIEVLLKDQDGNPVLSDLDTAGLRGGPLETAGKRIVFSDDDDDTPF